MKIGQFFKYLIIGPVRMYQIFLSPLLGKNCRYNPTCSHYMIQAVEEWGPIKGTWLGLRRIGRCHPWGGMGNDPVPKNEKKYNQSGNHPKSH
ncbi:MAG TPA: membrane protein insertion efficiency factor YidD [Saprospiraceae bacterium]|nr:membrane protein insertion efficiency factor YidD [Saprospiraceae bacterium]HRG64962.1 membrane protein insertion efficiency factor YidD [Saprospiraceae bacterium]